MVWLLILIGWYLLALYLYVAYINFLPRSPWLWASFLLGPLAFGVFAKLMPPLMDLFNRNIDAIFQSLPNASISISLYSAILELANIETIGIVYLCLVLWSFPGEGFFFFNLPTLYICTKFQKIPFSSQEIMQTLNKWYMQSQEVLWYGLLASLIWFFAGWLLFFLEIISI